MHNKHKNRHGDVSVRVKGMRTALDRTTFYVNLSVAYEVLHWDNGKLVFRLCLVTTTR